jgi:hypothetical protein
MTHAADRKEFDLSNFLHPAGAFRTPMDVVADPDLTLHEKRAILASWASDACAVDLDPNLRRPPSAPPVRFDDIMDALKHLDGEAAKQPHYSKLISRARRWKNLYRRNGGGSGPLFA